MIIFDTDLNDGKITKITNDFPLFAAAGPDGIRVAMGNAPDALKDLADYIAPSVEDHGFAAAMVHYGLIR